MMIFLTRSIGLALLCVCAITSSGCMTTPGHGEYIGNKNKKVSFGGYVLEPNTWVQIQTEHPTLGWQTVGWAKSANYSFTYDGQQWYPWSKSIKLPAASWIPVNESMNAAYVRVVQYNNGNVLYTFDQGFGSWFDPETSLADMWSDHGHGTEIVIFSGN